MSNETETENKIEFLAVTAFGYAFADSPAMAMSKIQAYAYNPYGQKPRKGSEGWQRAQDGIILWMVPSNQWTGTEFYRPVDKDGKPCGILLHGYRETEQALEAYNKMEVAL